MDPDAVADVGRAHHGGEPDRDLLDFSANTNPRRPDGVEATYRAAFDEATRYPDDGYDDFRAAAAAFVDCDPAAVHPTPGGLAAVRLAMATQLAPGDEVLLPAPSFAEYAREARLQGAEPSFVAADAVVDADPEPYALAVVCTPNNPTGAVTEPAELRAFAARCRAVDTTLVVDEAFLGFTDRPSLAGEPGVVVTRSLTKLFGLPGIRAGFAVADGALADDLATARRAWNCSTPAVRVGARCLRAEAFVAETRDRVAAERERLAAALSERYGVRPSEAPYLLLEVPADAAPDRDGDDPVDRVLARARDRGVAIRDARTFRRLNRHVRVAVKERPANDRLLEAMDVRHSA
ncbi:MAG: aminotransferase class I/II-fold pyridoxal phosphate-dependent enzyme [Halolamina sp.]